MGGQLRVRVLTNLPKYSPLSKRQLNEDAILLSIKSLSYSSIIEKDKSESGIAMAMIHTRPKDRSWGLNSSFNVR
jgi:hypothetical protein